jgi:hypothetical protein
MKLKPRHAFIVIEGDSSLIAPYHLKLQTCAHLNDNE